MLIYDTSVHFPSCLRKSISCNKVFYSKVPVRGHLALLSSWYKDHHWVQYFTRVHLDSVPPGPATSFQWAKTQPRSLALGISLLSPDPIIFSSCFVSTQIFSHTFVWSLPNLLPLHSKSLGLSVIFHKNTLKISGSGSPSPCTPH